jgi:Spy/CpxP family protein refolding chaperone
MLAALALVLTFAAGFLVGAYTHRAMFLRHPPEPAMRMMLQHLDSRLDLSDAQVAEVRQILGRRHHTLMKELDEANVEIERILTPEQRKRFAKMRMRLHGHR